MDDYFDRCPYCNYHVESGFDKVYGEYFCAQCGKLLYFLKLSGGIRFFPHREAKRLHRKVLAVLCEYYGLSETEIAKVAVGLPARDQDSLAVMELSLALEECVNDELDDPKLGNDL